MPNWYNVNKTLVVDSYFDIKKILYENMQLLAVTWKIIFRDTDIFF